MRKLMQKSIEWRNGEAIQKLANIEAIRNWSKQPPIPIPKVKMPEIKEGKPGWYIFFRAFLP